MSSTESIPLSKSQKKRMKRNKAKLRKAENDASAIQNLDPLNAHDAMLSRLQKLGHDLTYVNEIIEQMWNNNLDYSDINAVVTFIDESKAADEANIGETKDTMTPEMTVTIDMAPSLSIDKRISKSEDPVTLQELNTVSTSSFSTTPPSKKESEAFSSSSEVVPSATNDKIEGIKKSTYDEATEHENFSSVLLKQTNGGNGQANGGTNGHTNDCNTKTKKVKANKAAKPATPPSLKTKLNIVANTDNLTDAIVALTEWIVKAATPYEIKLLCDNNKPCALHTVIRRAIVSPGPRSLSGQLLDLIGSILRVTGIPSTELSCSAKILMCTFSKAKAAIDLDESMRESIADYVADTVTLKIFNTVEMISTVSSGSSGSLASLDAEIQSMKAAKLPNDEGVKALIAKRDHLKTLAQKKSNHLNIMILSTEEGCTDSKIASQESKDEMMSKIFGSKYEEIVASRAKYHELKKKQNESKSTNYVRESIVSNIESLKVKKNSVCDKIKELETELKKLSKEQEALEKELIEAQDKLVNHDDLLSQEVKETERAVVEVTKTMEVSDSISDVVDTLQNFRKEMDKMTSTEMESLQKSMPTVDLVTELAPQFNSYLECMNDYFYSEWKLVSYLQNRAHEQRDTFTRLEMEIEECESLGMTNVVEAMKKKLLQAQQNVTDDDNIINALKAEAETMRSDLTKTIKEFSSVHKNNDDSFTSVLKTMESTIDAIL